MSEAETTPGVRYARQNATEHLFACFGCIDAKQRRTLHKLQIRRDEQGNALRVWSCSRCGSSFAAAGLACCRCGGNRFSIGSCWQHMPGESRRRKRCLTCGTVRSAIERWGAGGSRPRA